MRWIHNLYQAYKDWGVQIAATSGAFDWHDAVHFITSGAQITEM